MSEQDQITAFEDVKPTSAETGGPFVVDVDGYEGPLDLLLSLAREQKVDLARISILELANQYLDFVEQTRNLRLELAAEYLVMAAWLAYLKSRLLLPVPVTDEPSGEEMSARLAFQLQRLDAMREVAEELLGQTRLGIDVFQRGAPEGIAIIHNSAFECSLFDLLTVRRQEAMTKGWPELPEWVFCSESGTAPEPGNVDRVWRRVRRRDQKEGVRPLKLHCARHTWATMALRAG